MHWLYLLLAAGTLVFAVRTTSPALMIVGLLATLGLLIAWVMGWYSARLGESGGGASQMIDPAELHRLRELAEARKANAAARPPEPPAP
ncbi:hypothetical protein [Pseudoxanthomonas mexicana]|uniref:hypothetical protein n=1 Tax=Pseudoxanthomonas mexicana TaxID=128785 RepID=UPI00398BB61A